MFDWITWSIWLVGFVILVIWIVVPYQELRKILKKHESEKPADRTDTP